jgi:KDO2-lipid IV(A) lauroyltransferase
MARPRSPILDYLVYLAIRLFVCVVQALSLQAGCSFARQLARVVYHVDRRHRLVADENLKHAFPGRFTDEQRDQLVRAVYRHFCTLLIEIIHLPRRLHANNWKSHVELPGGRRLLECVLSDRPLLIVTGHFGNWELGGFLLGLLGFTTHAVARPLDNTYLDDFLRRFREHTGQGILAKKGDVERMQEILDSGGILATLADQDAGQRGLFVDFFGRPASTHKAIALLALEHRVPLLVALPRNTGIPLHYSIDVADLILPEEYADQPDAIRQITQRFTSALERGIRQSPEQYFWVHRRWKHQPAKVRRKAA